jgi:hypothetical protein
MPSKANHSDNVRTAVGAERARRGPRSARETPLDDDEELSSDCESESDGSYQETIDDVNQEKDSLSGASTVDEGCDDIPIIPADAQFEEEEYVAPSLVILQCRMTFLSIFPSFIIFHSSSLFDSCRPTTYF